METIEHLIQHPKKRLHETPLFFQHGAWHGAWCWEQFMDYFAGLGYEVHAISLPGHGNSSTNKGHINRYRYRDYVDCMAAEIARVSPEPVVIGHSLGGGIVQKYLETHRLPGAVLLASLPTMGMMGMTLRMLWRYPWLTIKSALLLDGYAWVETPEVAKAQFLGLDTTIDMYEFHARLVAEPSLVGYRTLFPPCRPHRVHSPVLVLAAAKDVIFTLSEERRTAKTLRAQFHVFAGQAHNLMMEPAWPQVAATIDHWVTDELHLP